MWMKSCCAVVSRSSLLLTAMKKVAGETRYSSDGMCPGQRTESSTQPGRLTGRPVQINKCGQWDVQGLFSFQVSSYSAQSRSSSASVSHTDLLLLFLLLLVLLHFILSPRLLPPSCLLVSFPSASHSCLHVSYLPYCCSFPKFSLIFWVSWSFLPRFVSTPLSIKQFY